MLSKSPSPSLIRYATISPVTGATLASFPLHSDADVETTLSRARQTFLQYRTTSFEDRSQWILNAGDLLESRAGELGKIITEEMGKPLKQAVAEVKKCAVLCRYFASNAEKFLKREVIETEASKSYIEYQPLGPLLGIFPWNFPFWQVIRFAVPTLMAGNVVVFKHAPNVPQCSLAIEQLFHDSGLPSYAVQNLFIDNDQASTVIRDHRIMGVTLTGSTQAGAAVAAIAASVVKKAVLELGGSDPFIVLSDADIELAVEQAVIGRMQNNGQSCIAAKRFIVEDSVYGTFCEKFSSRVGQLNVGDPSLENTDIGPLARPDLLEALASQVDRSVAMGAVASTGGHRVGSVGNFYAPTVLSDVVPGMPAFDEETFGPVAAVIRARDEAHAIELANQSEYGLGGAVFSENVEKAERVALSLESGQAFINGFTRSDPRLPFGGIKMSGYGRECSAFGLREFINVKTVWSK